MRINRSIRGKDELPNRRNRVDDRDELTSSDSELLGLLPSVIGVAFSDALVRSPMPRKYTLTEVAVGRGLEVLRLCEIQLLN
jgi:hypothetical protein